MRTRARWVECWLARGLVFATPLFAAALAANARGQEARAPDAAAPAVFQAGFAERDITPDIGSEAPGGYGKAYHRTLHDPCKARAAVFDDGRSRVALVGIDAISIRRETVLNIRKAIAAHTGIPENAVLIGASHSHSSGPLSGVFPGEYDHASDLVQKLAYEHTICADPKYVAKVEQAIVDAVRAAHDGRVAALTGVGKGVEERVAFNRRFRVRSGGAITHPGQGNPEILGPAGPVDPEVIVVGAWDDKHQRLLGCVVNFACHATTNPGGISANYVCYLEKAIQGYFGPETVVVFLNGASGDVTQVDNLSVYKHPTGERSAQLVGGRVGAEALKTLLSMEPGSLAPVAAESTVLKIPRRAPSAARVKRCLELVEAGPPRGDPTEWTFAKEILLLDARLQKEPVAEAEVQVIQVGPVAYISDPAEFFCEFGLRLKAKSGFPYTCPVSLANGVVGYVPTKEAFGPDGGGYETRLTKYSNLAIDAGDRLVEAGLELAGKLKPGPVPQPPKALPFSGKPWSYGNNRPELE